MQDCKRHGQCVIPVVLAANSTCVPVLSVCIKSIAVHASLLRSYHVYVFHMDIRKKDVRVIEQEFCTGYFHVEFVDVSSQMKGLKLKGKGLITKETYFRFLIPEILRRYDKAVYLDTDIVVCRDIAQLYDIDLKGCLLAAVPEADLIGQYHGANPDTRQYCDRVLQMRDINHYFQAGVLVWNVSAWREKVDIRRLFRMAQHGHYRYSDQDILNIVCEEHVLRLNMEWNTLTDNGGSRVQVISHAPEEIQSEYRHARRCPAVIHYAGSHKPWKEPGGDFAQEFWKMARQTPYYEQILTSACRYAALMEHPSAGIRAVELLRRAAKRVLPQESRIRRISAGIYWRLK